MSKDEDQIEWRGIETAPVGQQILVWESDYGWLLAHKDHRYGWQLKSSGNFYGEMAASVVANLLYWMPLTVSDAAAIRNRTA